MVLIRRFFRENCGGTYIEYAMIGLILTLATMSFITALMTAFQEKEAEAILEKESPAAIVRIKKSAVAQPPKEVQPKLKKN